MNQGMYRRFLVFSSDHDDLGGTESLGGTSLRGSTNTLAEAIDQAKKAYEVNDWSHVWDQDVEEIAWESGDG